MAVAESDGRLWTIDEYVVVADLYLRRRRSSNARDPEVIALAQLTGRSTASISRRLGNFHGTMFEGSGLKPVVGDARQIFLAMSEDDRIRAQVASDARARLDGVSNVNVLVPAVSVLLVDPERMLTQESSFIPSSEQRKSVRAESQLVVRYIQWRGEQGTMLRSALLTDGAVLLRTDLYDPEGNLLIEAKSTISRETLRYAIGQLLDYRRFMSPYPNLAVLLPGLPDLSMRQLLGSMKIAVIAEFPDKTFKYV